MIAPCTSVHCTAEYKVQSLLVSLAALDVTYIAPLADRSGTVYYWLFHAFL